MTMRFVAARLLSALLLMSCCALPACETQTTTVSDTPQPGERINPSVGIEAPTDLHDIAGYLLRYRVNERKLPESLAVLREEGIMPAEGYPGLNEYAYRATGMGTLSDGRTIIVVDTAVRVEGHAWCILAEPSRNPRTATLAVSLVRMDELQAAARRSR